MRCAPQNARSQKCLRVSRRPYNPNRLAITSFRLRVQALCLVTLSASRLGRAQATEPTRSRQTGVAALAARRRCRRLSTAIAAFVAIRSICAAECRSKERPNKQHTGDRERCPVKGRDAIEESGAEDGSTATESVNVQAFLRAGAKDSTCSRQERRHAGPRRPRDARERGTTDGLNDTCVVNAVSTQSKGTKGM